MASALGSSLSPGSSGRQHKRLRTRRACDYCRAHRIRCEWSKSAGDCDHCVLFGIACEQVAPPPKRAARKSEVGRVLEPAAEGDVQGLEPGYLGPSNYVQLAQALESSSSTLKTRVRAFDYRHDIFRTAVSRQQGGVLYARDGRAALGATATAGPVYSRAVERLSLELGEQLVLEKLLETCRTRILPNFPVISASESVGMGEPPEEYYAHFAQIRFDSQPHTPLPRLTRLVHCTLPALSREVPAQIRASLLRAVRTILDDGSDFRDLLADSSLTSVQMWTLLGMAEELHADDAAASHSLIWQRAGRGLRVALELGLHRNLTPDAVPHAQLRRRRRVWAACTISDRWLAVSHGQVLGFNSEEVDAPLPAASPDHIAETDKEASQSFRFLLDLTRLSILLERAYRLTSSSSGLDRASDISLWTLHNDIEYWYSQLPGAWPYSKKLDNPAAPFLMELFAIGVEFTFYRPFFLEPTANVPTHINWTPPAAKWSALVSRSRRSLDWLAGDGSFFLDCWSMTAYPAFVCVIIQAHAAMHGDSDALAAVENAATLIAKWAEVPGCNGSFGCRQRMREVVDMLAQSLRDERGVGALMHIPYV